MFKNNDLVKYIGSENVSLTYGKEYKVLNQTKNYIHIKDDFDCLSAFSKKLFKKVEDNNMELKITKEKVLEAAQKCSKAKETLKTLFPEVFEDDKSVDVGSVVGKSFFNNDFLTVRADYEYQQKGFYLTHKYNWEIIKDSQGKLVLVPTKK